jgi:hypothetical protein
MSARSNFLEVPGMQGVRKRSELPQGTKVRRDRENKSYVGVT